MGLRTILDDSAFIELLPGMFEGLPGRSEGQKRQVTPTVQDLRLLNPHTGCARFSWPGSIWSAPTPVLSNIKYLTIEYKRIDLERSGHDKRARPLGRELCPNNEQESHFIPVKAVLKDCSNGEDEQ